ncbi:6039_t:CDS:2 [Diversispora eburnea]|uniref:6039_t:CDS:1 n=1 Tax=Diversispora eburnea TaxID=1213867 RepID=A0A9N9FUU6_9GLOM|nr:6039_t:CDS:2 [Diversispora eburnea]
MESRYIDINCLVFDMPYSDAFSIKIGCSDMIRIYNGYSICADSLILLKVNKPLGRTNDKLIFNCFEEEKLVAIVKIRDYEWLDTRKYLQVIIKLPEIVRLTTITLNCLVIPSGSPENLSVHDVISLQTSYDETVDKLRLMIRERWAPVFENILPTNFILHHIDRSTSTTIKNQIDFYKLGRGEYGDNSTELSPGKLIYKYFRIQPFSEKIHIIVKLGTQTS